MTKTDTIYNGAPHVCAKSVRSPNSRTRSVSHRKVVVQPGGSRSTKCGEKELIDKHKTLVACTMQAEAMEWSEMEESDKASTRMGEEG